MSWGMFATLITRIGLVEWIKLPQSWQDFCDPRVFLSHLRYAASLRLDFWDPTIKLSCYTVIKWGEANPQS